MSSITQVSEVYKVMYEGFTSHKQILQLALNPTGVTSGALQNIVLEENDTNSKLYGLSGSTIQLSMNIPLNSGFIKTAESVFAGDAVTSCADWYTSEMDVSANGCVDISANEIYCFSCPIEKDAPDGTTYADATWVLSNVDLPVPNGDVQAKATSYISGV